MTQIIGVSKSGVNVLTATNPNDFIFHSLYNSFKIIAYGSASYTIAAGSTSGVFKTVAHGLGYKPFVISFIKWADGRAGMPFSSKKGATGSIYNRNYYISTSNINWEFINTTGSSESIVLSYFLCEVPAN